MQFLIRMWCKRIKKSRPRGPNWQRTDKRSETHLSAWRGAKVPYPCRSSLAMMSSLHLHRGGGCQIGAVGRDAPSCFVWTNRKKNLGTRRCRRTVLVLHTAMGNFVRAPSVGQNSEESDVFFCHVISHTKSPIKLEKPPSSPCCKDYVRGGTTFLSPLVSLFFFSWSLIKFQLLIT